MLALSVTQSTNRPYFNADSQPQCVSGTDSPVPPNDEVTLTCQVSVCHFGSYKLKLVEDENQLQVGSTTSVSWSGPAGSVTGAVVCSATTWIQSQCPVFKG